MRTLVAAAVAVAPLVLQPDAARVLADMRQALGGDAAIAAIQSFSVTGSVSLKLEGVTVGVSDEWSAVLPDSVVRVRRNPQEWGTDVTIDGFRGDALIRRSNFVRPDADPRDGGTPAERARKEALAVRKEKRQFSRLAIALIGLPAVDPVDVSYQGQQTVAGRMCDLLRLRASDGYAATLAVDAATHLPVSVMWMDDPITTVTLTTQSTVIVPSGRYPESVPPPPAPPPVRIDPPSGMSPVERQIVFDDFKAVEGLNWPHRFTQTIEGRLRSTTTIRKYKLNPKINPKLFDPGRR